MNQNWYYNYDGGGATYSRPDTGAHESKWRMAKRNLHLTCFARKIAPIPGQPPPALPHTPVPVSGAGIFIVILYKFFP